VSAVFQLADDAAPLAWVRLELLFDPGTFRSLRSAVADGVVCGSGRVAGQTTFAWAQDGDHLGGSLGAVGGATIASTIARAGASGAPVVGFPHSGGARLQEGAAALDAYAAIFRAQAIARVPQISVISGACAGGAAYSPALGDVTIMAGARARMFVTGPQVVAQVMREEIDATTLGGAAVHERNGVCHLRADDDVHAARLARHLLSYLGSAVAPPADPEPGDPGEVVPDDPRRVYDVRAVAARLLDEGSLLELAPRWGRSLVVAFARLDGRPVGLIANQPRFRGGTLDCSSAEKGAWFVSLCDRHMLPLVVLVDTPGFLPGATQEQLGVIRHGASLLRAFARSRSQRITVTLRQAYGGAHIVMNSSSLGADYTFAWPTARIGVMGARQAVAITERRAIAAGADPAALAAAYEADRLPAAVAARGGFIDELIAPSETRERLIAAFESSRARDGVRS
jgi:acetyl-CoA carboxylase carboxyltransferase component